MSKTTIVPSAPKILEPFNPSPQIPQRFLSLRDVLGRLTISRSLLYELIKDPKRPFPSPVHLGRRSVWLEGEVEAYMREVVESERN
jgi:predicted DNA-binding transcriptional regulator AlpA